MTTGHVFMATSLDGFVARADHNLDWLNAVPPPSDGDDMGYAAFTASVDGIVMGRATFETVMGFDIEWPYTLPVVVMTQTLTDADLDEALSGKVRVSAKSPTALMQELSEAGWQRAYVDGGRLVQAFLNAGLIDDLILTTVPVLLGDGVRLFGPTEGDVALEHLAHKRFDNGLVQNTWRVLKATG